MEPISSAIAALPVADSGIAVGKAATFGLARAARSLILTGTYDPTWITLGVFEGQQSELTAHQIDEVHEFLSSSSIKPVLSVLCIGLLLEDSGEASQAAETARRTFLDQAKIWTVGKKQGWYKSAPDIFASLIDLYRGTVPNEIDEKIFRHEIQSYSNFLKSPLSGSSHNTLQAKYVDNLITLLQDLQALSETVTISEHLTNAIIAAGDAPIIAHTDIDRPVGFDRLYVNRDFQDIASGEANPSDDLVASGSPFRIYIVGSPGAGKTTFVNYLVSALADSSKRVDPLPSIIIRCRDYVRSNWQASIKAAILTKLNSQYGTDLSNNDVEHLLILGRLAVIFDGLDEITDVDKRQQMVQRIQVFAGNYPPTSILVTTRELGYQRAPLDQKIFTGVQLKEFSSDQVEEYCTRWFEENEKPELFVNFMRDSETVLDLRTNPLLLSLLCVLYRSRGAIPAQRRAIYHQCAQLLFHRWDQARQIETNEAMPEFGDDLMQEIARWTFSSTAAQGGIQEQQLVKVLATYLQQNDGYNYTKSYNVAANFAEYCAGRAWLLGTIGNEDGQRIFAFTHRTFYEYFTAEAYARSAKTSNEVAEIVRNEFAKDSTSVLPELLIQSFGHHKTRGDAEVFGAITTKITPSILLLRLMNGSRLPRPIRAKGFSQMLREWEGGSYGESFDVLLGANEAARDHFLEDFILPPQCIRARQLFMAGWSGCLLSGTAPAVTSSWQASINDLVEKYGEEFSQYTAPSTINWLRGHGHTTIEPKSSWELLVCYSPHGWVPGALWWTIEELLVGERNARDLPLADSLKTLCKEFDDGKLIPQPVVERLVEALLPTVADQLPWGAPDENRSLDRKARDLLAYLVLAMSETKDPFETLRQSVSPCWPGYFAGLPEYRNWKLGVVGAPRRRGPEEIRKALETMPSRLHSWAMGKVDFVKETYSDEEDSVRFRVRPPRDVEKAYESIRLPETNHELED